MNENPSPPLLHTSQAETYDIAEDRKALERSIGADELDALTGELYLDDLRTILTFGEKASEGVARASEEILQGLSRPTGNPKELLAPLKRITQSFNPDALFREAPFFARLFDNSEKRIDDALASYQAMARELEHVYIALKQYEDDLIEVNRGLERLFEETVAQYRALVKYVLAGEQGLSEIRAYIDARSADIPDDRATLEIRTYKNSMDALERRVRDLRTTEVVAMQALPMLTMLYAANKKLIVGFHNAFMVTLPTFREGLRQTIALKQQHMQDEAMQAVARKARNAMKQLPKEQRRSAAVTNALDAADRKKLEALYEAHTKLNRGVDDVLSLRRDAETTRLKALEGLNKKALI